MKNEDPHRHNSRKKKKRWEADLTKAERKIVNDAKKTVGKKSNREYLLEVSRRVVTR